MTHLSVIIRFLRDKTDGLKDTDRVVLSVLGVKAIISELEKGSRIGVVRKHEPEGEP
jgi:hypothetical protein